MPPPNALRCDDSRGRTAQPEAQPPSAAASVTDEQPSAAVPATGAAPGEIALHAEGVLHVGDALIHLPSTGFAPLPDKYCTDPRELRAALGKLLRFPCEVLTFAHGLPLVTHARQRLADLLA